MIHIAPLKKWFVTLCDIRTGRVSHQKSPFGRGFFDGLLFVCRTSIFWRVAS